MSASSSSQADLGQAYKNWFNATFVPSGQNSSAEIGITLHSAQGSVVLPLLVLGQSHTLRQIFVQAIELAQDPHSADRLHFATSEAEVLPPAEPVQEPLPPGYDFDHIEYRKKIYIVHSQYEDGAYRFTVERQEDRKIIDPSKATWKHVVDAYKQAHPGRFTEE